MIRPFLIFLFSVMFFSFSVVAENDSVFVQLKNGKILAFEFLEYDTVSVDEEYINVSDTSFYSGLVRRVVFNRSVLKQDFQLQFVSFKFRNTDDANAALLGRNFAADTDELTNNDTISFVIPYLTNFKLTPFFVTNSHKIKVYVNGEEVISAETVIDFTAPVAMKLVYEDGTEREYTVIVKNSGLPVVVVDTPGQSAVKSKSVWTENSSMMIYYPNGSLAYDSGTDKMNIRGRGNSTWSYQKKPYNIKLNTKKSILGMPKHKRWCLLANYIDRTLMRNAVAFELAKMTAMDWTPNGRFVEFVLNGEPLGNYYLCEAIRIDNDRVNINEMSVHDTSGEAITGGYLLELDSYYDAEKKFKTDYFRMPVNIKQPEEDEINSYQYSYIKNYFNAGEKKLYESSLDGFAEYFDLTTLIDWYLLNELVYNTELKHPKSSYMHKDKGGKLKMGPAWDYDWETFTPHYSMVNNKTMWFGSLFAFSDFKKMVKERWNILKPSFSTIDIFMEETREYIRTSWEFNEVLWPNISNKVNGDVSLSYDDAVDRMKESFYKRLETLDGIINAW